MLPAKKLAAASKTFTLLLLVFIGFSAQTVSAQTERIIYTTQPGTPVGIQNFPQIEIGCSFLGVGGQVFDHFGSPLTGLVVKVFGSLNGQSILLFGITGGASDFGPGGFLLTIAEQPIRSVGTLFLQVMNLAGKELSTPIVFDTYDDCSRNLTVLNIVEGVIQNPLMLPQVFR